MKHLYRLATRSPGGFERRTLLKVDDCDDEKLAAAGWNLLAQVMVADGWTDDERDKFERVATAFTTSGEEARMEDGEASPSFYAARYRAAGFPCDDTLASVLALSAELSQWRSKILSKTPRATVPGVDVDGKIVDDVAEHRRRWVAAFAHFKLAVRVSDSGLPGKGSHIQHGPIENPTPDAMRAYLRGLYKYIIPLTGLVPRLKSGAHGGMATSLVLPKDANTGGKDVVTSDLVPVNHAADATGRMFRPLGGVYKDGIHRKRLIEGSPLVGDPIPDWLFVEAPPEQKRENIGASAARARVSARRDPVVALPHVDALESHLARFLRSIRLKENHHDERTAFAALAQDRAIHDKAFWVEALTSAWGDRPDVVASWNTTVKRKRENKRCRGRGFLRKRLGARYWSDFCDAIARDSGRAYTNAAWRLGTDGANRYHIADIRTLIENDAEKFWLNKRLDAALSCRSFDRQGDCVDCEKAVCKKHKIHCDVRELCWTCNLRWIRNVEDSIMKHWPDYVLVAISHGHDDPKHARRELDKRHDSHKIKTGDRVLKLTSPALDGTYDLTMFATLRELDSAILRGYGVEYHKVHRRRAASIAAKQLAMRFVAVNDLLDHGKTAEAVALLTELRGTHSVTGQAHAKLHWPTEKQSADERKAAMREKDDSGEYCECPVGTPARWTVTHAASGIPIIVNAPHPPSLPEALAIHRMAAEAVEDHPPAPPDRPIAAWVQRVPLRL